MIDMNTTQIIAVLIALFAYFVFGIVISVTFTGIVYGGGDGFWVNLGRYVGLALAMSFAILSSMYLRVVGVIG